MENGRSLRARRRKESDYINNQIHGMGREETDIASKPLYVCKSVDRRRSAVSRLEASAKSDYVRGLRDQRRHSADFVRRRNEAKTFLAFGGKPKSSRERLLANGQARSPSALSAANLEIPSFKGLLRTQSASGAPRPPVTLWPR